MKKLGLFIIAILSFTLGKAQTTIITDDSTYTPSSYNAIMEVHSANGNKGILIPRLTTAERTAISTSATNDVSLLVYDTDTETFWYFDGSAWVEIATGGTVSDDQLLTLSNDTLYIEDGNWIYLGTYGNDWKLTGNAATSSNFIGTTSNIDFKIRTNNTERMTVEANGNVGIGTTSPTSGLHIVKSSSTEPTLTVEHNSNNSTDKAFRLLSQGQENIIFHPNGGGYFMNNIGIGTTAPTYKLDVVGGNIRASGEIISTMNSGSGQFRAIGGNYGAFIRNDGTSTYLPLITASGDQYGTWNALRPLRINNATGDVYLANGTSIFRHSDGFVGIGTTVPTQKLDVSGNVKFSGALMPNNNAGTAGYLLKSQGAGLPPVWEAPASVPLYGNNASSVSVNSLVYTTNTSSWTDITGATLTFTPEHSTFYIFSSLCARLADNSGMAQFGQAMIQVRVLVNGVEVAKAATTITDYDDVNGVLTSGTVSFSGVRTSATIGSSTTVKLQWKPVILWASSPWRVEINPTLTDVADHCVLTVFD